MGRGVIKYPAIALIVADYTVTWCVWMVLIKVTDLVSRER